MKIILYLLLPLWLFSASISTTVIDANETGATVKLAHIDIGVSGFIVRHFNDEHSAIIASATVNEYDPDTRTAVLRLSAYDGLRQNSLPDGAWKPRAGDEAVLAFAYGRGVLLAPDSDTYFAVTSRIRSVEWIHPDGFAAFLSYRGHPTPLESDIKEYCALSSVGLLYIYMQSALFTLDCKSLSVLQITPAPFTPKEYKKPFYTRIGKIEANWFGEGSDEIEDYEKFYDDFVTRHNQNNKKLAEFTHKDNNVSK